MTAAVANPRVRLTTASAVLGALVFSAGGFLMGSMNSGWFSLERDANSLFPLLGVGIALVVISFAPGALGRELREFGGLGRATGWLLVAAPSLYILSWIIELAIIGTLALAAGLICLSTAVWRRQLFALTDRVLITASAIGSITWNTETRSAFLLVGVGLLWVILSARLLPRRGAERR
jgi:hypothetical protein